MERLIEYKNVTLAREEQTLFRGIDFDVKPGEFIYLIGKVGSGKSSWFVCRLELAGTSINKIRFSFPSLSVQGKYEQVTGTDGLQKSNGTRSNSFNFSVCWSTPSIFRVLSDTPSAITPPSALANAPCRSTAKPSGLFECFCNQMSGSSFRSVTLVSSYFGLNYYAIYIFYYRMKAYSLLASSVFPLVAHSVSWIGARRMQLPTHF